MHSQPVVYSSAPPPRYSPDMYAHPRLSPTMSPTPQQYPPPYASVPVNNYPQPTVPTADGYAQPVPTGYAPPGPAMAAAPRPEMGPYVQPNQVVDNYGQPSYAHGAQGSWQQVGPQMSTTVNAGPTMYAGGTAPTVGYGQPETSPVTTHMGVGESGDQMQAGRQGAGAQYHNKLVRYSSVDQVGQQDYTQGYAPPHQGRFEETRMNELDPYATTFQPIKNPTQLANPSGMAGHNVQG